jgi:hypothetical protein
MKAKLFFALLMPAVCIVSGCSVTGRLYPVQGPMASLTAPPLMTAKLYESPSRVTLTLANGELFNSRLQVLYPSSSNLNPTGAPPAPPQPNLAYAWDTVYGQGFFVAHVLGQQLGQAVITGSQGTIVQVEVAVARGVAIDSKGNFYKIVW